MPVSLWTALKVIPWKDVVDAAPAVVAAAKALRKNKPEPPPDTTATASIEPRLQQMLLEQSERITALESTLGELAEHHVRLITAIDVLRTRTRWLMVGVCVTLAIALLLAYRLGQTLSA
ncbi:MAG: hypothetical protein RL357_1406 [Pseudomonadota bacterium]|jgi:hypothetical protein